MLAQADRNPHVLIITFPDLVFYSDYPAEESSFMERYLPLNIGVDNDQDTKIALFQNFSEASLAGFDNYLSAKLNNLH